MPKHRFYILRAPGTSPNDPATIALGEADPHPLQFYGDTLEKEADTSLLPGTSPANLSSNSS